jgi:hypothetical protein
MKLSEYAKEKSISYKTAHRHWKLGYIKGEQLSSGTIVVFDNQLNSDDVFEIISNFNDNVFSEELFIDVINLFMFKIYKSKPLRHKILNVINRLKE